jgi:hypothetical protein
MSGLSAVVSGSFRPTTLYALRDTIGDLERHGFSVLAPHFAEMEYRAGMSFPVLDSDDHTKSPHELERDFLDKIGKASLHVTVNPINGRLGRSSAAEYAFAAVHGVARVITSTSVITSRDHPDIWFDGVGPAQEAALDRLSWSKPNLYYESSIVLPGLLTRIRDTQPLPYNHPDRLTLTSIYEELLADLSNTPLVAANPMEG